MMPVISEPLKDPQTSQVLMRRSRKNHRVSRSMEAGQPRKRVIERSLTNHRRSIHIYQLEPPQHSAHSINLLCKQGMAQRSQSLNVGRANASNRVIAPLRQGSQKDANLFNASITAGTKLFPPPCPASSRTCSRQVVHRWDNRQAVINGPLISKRPWMSTPGIPFNFAASRISWSSSRNAACRQ